MLGLRRTPGNKPPHSFEEVPFSEIISLVKTGTMFDPATFDPRLFETVDADEMIQLIIHMARNDFHVLHFNRGFKTSVQDEELPTVLQLSTAVPDA